MRFAALFLLAALAACAIAPPAPRVNLQPVSFDDLDGWRDDAPVAALAAFRHSCHALMRKPAAALPHIEGVKAGDWRRTCAAAQDVAATDAAARAFFERSFQPYAVSGPDGADGLFTGYYVPELRAALHRGGAFQTPLYGRPGDLIAVDLGLFKSTFKGQHIVGKVTGHDLVPYDDRAAIARGSLANRAPVLAWVDDPTDAFFLEIQGSGRLRLTDGSVLSLGYDGANGRDYVAIGRVMAARDDIARPVTMKKIRDWLAAHPAQAQNMMNANPSYVFFRRLPGDDVFGAEGVALTPRRSLAVDPAFIPLGAPVWLDTSDSTGTPFRHLMVAQDTGGAIKGPVRGDVFWGAGSAAATQAGAMQSRGRYDLLLPKTNE
ncbi:MAG: murein transglycosylase A [Alphaproteobacteria bacterium]|nr:murein transglycosylase A [Alphaproteobacteria bacterium]